MSFKCPKCKRRSIVWDKESKVGTCLNCRYVVDTITSEKKEEGKTK